MSFQDTYKITNADRVDKGVYGLPDTPGMTTAAIQERFDSLGNLAIDKFNALVEAASDEIDGSDDKFPTNKAVQNYISGQGGAIIDDTTPSLHKAYSSQKVENMFGSVAERVIDDSEPSENKTYSSAEIEEKLSDIPSPESIIDDDTASTDTTYSSSKLESDFISVSDTEEQTATDEFTTINGGLLSSLKVALTPIQDLHGYDSPWVGGSRKNKFDILSYSTLDPYVTVSDGNIRVNGSGSFRVARYNSLYFAQGTYTLSFKSVIVSGTEFIAVLKSDDTFIFSDNGVTITNYSRTFTIPENGTYKFAIGSATNDSADITFSDIQIELGSTATSYEPYSNICPISGHTEVDIDVSDGQATQEQVTVNLGGTYYSGTLDVVTGVFTPDTADEIYDGSVDETWNMVTGDGYHQFATSRTDLSNTTNAFCNEFKNISIDERGQKTGFVNYLDTTIRVALKDSDILITSVADWRTFLSNNPLQVNYELATPTPIQLSPTMVKALVGENHLSAPLEGQEITESVYSPLAKWNAVIDDTTASDDTTYSSNKINAIVPKIDDSATSASKVFSSLKTAALITELSERFDFSTTEKPLGWWTDGKVYYGKVINIAGCPKEMFGLMVDLGVEVDTFIGIFAVGNAKDDNYNGGYCMGGTIYCKVIKSEGQNTQIQPACAVMALGGASLLVLYTKVE